MATKIDYFEFDKKLLEMVASGKNEFNILVGKMNEDAKVFCTGSVEAEPFRVIDRRLQALRKKQLVVYNSKTGWSVKVVEVRP